MSYSQISSNRFFLCSMLRHKQHFQAACLLMFHSFYPYF
ncbi:hypothetical protein l13_04550 [Neisseria weaveri ATCC 51223]|nr:hypothetical protein l13_04550 [Neisseria weaveri ATCC 51223]